MTARPLISLVLITALVLPSSVCAGPEGNDVEAQTGQTTNLLQKPAPGQLVIMEAGDAGTFVVDRSSTVPRVMYENLERKYRSAQKGVHLAAMAIVMGTTLFCIALIEGWIKLYTDCKS